MLADRLHIAVRPRSIAECLDLAVMFCGRRPLAVATAITIGAAPFAAFNRLVAAERVSAASDWFLVYVLLSMQAAWASIPLTLYLGQAVFEERFSWQQAFRSFAASLPAMIMFQGFLRGLCLVIMILCPVVFVGMYYVNQVILLERPTFSRIWSRRGAINQRISGKVACLALIDALILGVGVPIVTGFIGAITSLWNGQAIEWTAVDKETPLFPLLLSWHGQIAFWTVSGILTVFRFFTYLDARIRREGWDVELKLRAASTYGASPEPKPRRSVRAGAMAVVLLAVMLVSVAGAAQDPVEPGSRAKEALGGQSFPWYDAPQDRFHPVLDSRNKPRSTSHAWPDWDLDVSAPKINFGSIGTILLLGFYGFIAALVIYLVVRYGLPAGDSKSSDDDIENGIIESDDDRLAALPAEARLGSKDLLTRACDYAERGDFSKAMVFYYAWQLVEFDRRGAITLARGKTNGQYRAEVRRAAATLSDLFGRSSRLFEDAFFGDLVVLQADVEHVWNDRDLVATFVLPSDHDAPKPPSRSVRTSAILLALVVSLAGISGCGRRIDTNYAAVRGESINGISAFVRLLRSSGHSVKARQFLPESLDEKDDALVIFDQDFDGLATSAAPLLASLRTSNKSRTVVLVLRDSDMEIDYLRTLMELTDLSEEEKATARGDLADAETALRNATAQPRKRTLPLPDGLVTVSRDSDTKSLDVAVRKKRRTKPISVIARWELHRRLDPGMTMTALWSAGDDALLVQRQVSTLNILVLASATPLLNGGLVDPGNRQLAEDLVARLPAGSNMLVVGSAWTGMGSGGGEKSPWRFLSVQPMPWVAAQAIAAMALFCWCTSPIFGRPKRSSPAIALDFGHHVEAFATLASKSPVAARAFALVRLEAWRTTATRVQSKPRHHL